MERGTRSSSAGESGRMHLQESESVVRLPGLVMAALIFSPFAAFAADPSWRGVHARLTEGTEALRDTVSEARTRWVARAIRDGRDDLLPRLRAELPVERRPGYGVLPKLREADRTPSGPPRERRYSLRTLELDLPGLRHDATALSRQARRRSADIVTASSTLDRLRGRLALLDEHLAYHAFWQQAVIEWADYFADRNRLVERARQIARSKTDLATLDESRAALVAELARFRKTDGLHAVTQPDGGVVLRVRVRTDIQDAAFRQLFIDSIGEVFSGRAAGARRLSIELTLEVVDPAEIYPEGAPAPGQALAIDDHLSRFPKSWLVLTTGAASTHARTGRAVLLGPDPLERRVLAHEFAHLLGFEDAYLRGFDGSVEDREGVVLVEWSGLSNDLMGDPAKGELSDEMVQTLLRAYGEVGP